MKMDAGQCATYDTTGKHREALFCPLNRGGKRIRFVGER